MNEVWASQKNQLEMFNTDMCPKFEHDTGDHVYFLPFMSFFGYLPLLIHIDPT